MSKPSFDVARRAVWYTDEHVGPPPQCVRRDTFALRLAKRLRRARVSVDGKREGELAVVRVQGRTRGGERVVRTRRYRAR